MTIFGYNTDVNHADTIYHVQSEARQNDLLLQTLIYVKGQCVGKQAFSYAAQTLQPDFSEAAIHDLLKAQHKNAVHAIEQGHMESVLSLDVDIADIGGELVLNWINSIDQSQGNNLKMRFQVLDRGQAAVGAEIVVLSSTRGVEKLGQTRADSSGYAELQVSIGGLEPPAVIVQARWGGKSTTRKFRFRK